MNRRKFFLISATALAALASTTLANGEPASGIKLTVLYGHPKSPVDFEKYYAEKHMPLVTAVAGLRKFETSKGTPKKDGTAPAFYRIFEAWFDSPAHMAAITSTPEWKKVGADLSNFASGGITSLVSTVE